MTLQEVQDLRGYIVIGSYVDDAEVGRVWPAGGWTEHTGFDGSTALVCIGKTDHADYLKQVFLLDDSNPRLGIWPASCFFARCVAE